MTDEVERLFSICDKGGKGYLTENDLKQICPQLDDKDIAFIFAELDLDASGKIDKHEFLTGFEAVILRGESSGLGGMQRRASIVENDRSVMNRARAQEDVYDSESDKPSRPGYLRPFEEERYHSESDTNLSVDFSLPCQDEVLLLYEQLQSAGVPQLLRKYEKIVGSFHKEIKDKKEENIRLQHVYESEREMYNRRMGEVEVELDQQLAMAERTAREEERARLTKEKEEMQRKLEAEMTEMRSNIDRLQKMEKLLEQEGEKLSHQKELQEKLLEVSSENHQLRKGLAENHLEMAMIKSELAHVRADYERKHNDLVRTEDTASAAIEESEGVQKQLQLLFDANRKLHETNESLREALDSRSAVIKQFNLRTPSPFQRDSATPLSARSSAHHLFSPLVQQNAFSPAEDEYQEAGLVTAFDEYNSSSDSDRPTMKPAEPLVGINDANGPAERTFRVVMCGDAAVGKSSLVMRIIRGQYANNLPSTLGVDFHVKTINIDSRNVALQLWDTAGQERFRSLCKSYFRRADGAILVYDVTAEHSFLRVRDWVDTIKESVERHIPVILVGNKTDLRDNKSGVPTRDGAAMAAAMGILFTETSALDGSNVDAALLTLARELMAVEDVEIRSTGVILTPRPKKATGCFSRCSK